MDSEMCDLNFNVYGIKKHAFNIQKSVKTN